MIRIVPHREAHSPIDARGWHTRMRRLSSPHCDARPAGIEPSLLVIHNISLPPGQLVGDAVEALFVGRLDCSAHPFFQKLVGVRVSAHFLIRRDGVPTQFVSCADRAWHAGQSQWDGRERCNDFSLGIELEGTDAAPYEQAQYATLVQLSRVLCSRYPIADIVGHSDIAPGRKTDPGPAFDWSCLRAALRC